MLLHCRDGIVEVISGACFLPYMTLAIQVKKVKSLFHQTRYGCSSGRFSGLIGGELQRWLFFWELLLSPQRELCQNDHQVLGLRPD